MCSCGSAAVLHLPSRANLQRGHAARIRRCAVLDRGPERGGRTGQGSPLEGALRCAVVDGLVSPTDTQEYLQKRAKLFDTKKANAQYLNGNPLPSSDTVYLTTADSEGNAVSSESGSVAGMDRRVLRRSDHV